MDNLPPFDPDAVCPKCGSRALLGPCLVVFQEETGWTEEQMHVHRACASHDCLHHWLERDAPEAQAALREIWGDQPVLEQLGIAFAQKFSPGSDCATCAQNRAVATSGKFPIKLCPDHPPRLG